MMTRNKRFFGLLPGADSKKMPVNNLVINDGSEATIYIYDEISWYWGMWAEKFVEILNEITAPVINIRINCPGGDVFEAKPMQVAMAQHPSTVIVHIDGLCASAATFLCRGANKVLISDGGFLMIHNAWSCTAGNADEFRAVADMLDTIDGSIVNDYVKLTGLDEKQIRDWMAAETWFNADQALEHGFVDEIFEAEPVENLFDLSAYDNVPKDIRNFKARKKEDPPGPTFDMTAIDRQLQLAGVKIDIAGIPH